MKKLIILSSSLLIIIGLIMMYAGYNMAQGRFWGTAYLPGEYTTFYWGCFLLIFGIALAIVLLLYFRRDNYITEETNETGTSNQRQVVVGCVPKAVKFVAIFVGISGILLLITGFIKDAFYTFEGIGAIFIAVILYGLSYIIHAAIIYIKKQGES